MAKTTNQNITYKGLKVSLSRGKYSQYTYKSPFYGYKKAYRYNQITTVYYNDQIISKLMSKSLLHREIKSYLEAVVEYINDKDFTNMVNRYKQAKNLNLNFGFVRELRNKVNKG